ncbi:hypothetical protein ACFSZS_20110 [Seohaeicola zhoushanensis]
MDEVPALYEPDVGQVPGRPARLAAALILEDNMIIALDVKDILAELGAGTVHVARRVSEALRILDETHVTFALLDADLGIETSQRVAWACVERGIPVVLATGYGDDAAVMASFPKIPVLDKPYSTAGLRRAALDEPDA